MQYSCFVWGVIFLPDVDQKFRKRQTAYKTRIKGILDSKYIKTEGFDPNYLEISNQEVSRLNVIAVVVQKAEINNFKTLTIDDGTGRISARVFENVALLDKINVSDIVLIIGRPREFSSERYILIEAIQVVDPAWAKVRKLELENTTQSRDPQGNDRLVSTKGYIEPATDFSPNNKIIRLIKHLDKGEGVSIEDLSSRNIKDIDR
ncbi:MAG: hypothetical protein KKF65_06895 [Nanoarchaeota archaeon]|nr:hypothetical protein [Nanoarchaeota archaeon]